MEWLNEPPSWDARGGALLVTAGPQTDFWRTTHYGFVRDSGHLCFQSWDGDFVAEVKVTGAYRDQYDQAGLMVRRDERVWLKCGVEFVDGRQHASAVVTREQSDWSIAPLTGNPRSLWLRVSRTGPDVEVRYSVGWRALRPASPESLDGCWAAPRRSHVRRAGRSRVRGDLRRIYARSA